MEDETTHNGKVSYQLTRTIKNLAHNPGIITKNPLAQTLGAMWNEFGEIYENQKKEEERKRKENDCENF